MFIVILFGTQLIELFEILYKVVLVVKTALKYQVLPVDLFVVVVSHEIADGRHAHDARVKFRTQSGLLQELPFELASAHTQFGRQFFYGDVALRGKNPGGCKIADVISGAMPVEF